MKLVFRILVLTAFLALSAACLRVTVDTPEDGLPGSGDYVPLKLALSIGEGMPSSKSDIQTITEIAATPAFRGMTDIYLFPFETRTAIRTGNRSLSYSMQLNDISNSEDDQAVVGTSYHTGLVKNNLSHLYGGVMLPRRTASALVYGKAVGSTDAGAAGTVGYKQLNGSTISTGVTTSEGARYPEDITFSPEIIYSDTGTPAEATTLVDMLNSIVNSSYSFTQYYYRQNSGTRRNTTVTLSFNGSLDTKLNNYFNDYVGKEGTDYHSFGGSTQCVAAALTILYRALQGYKYTDNTDNYPNIGGYAPYNTANSRTDRLTYGHVYKNLCNEICDRIANLSGVSVSGSGTTATITVSGNYPEILGLPDGSSAIKFSGTAFTVLNNDDPANGMAPRSLYCYPAGLWWFSSSRVYTSDLDESARYVQSTPTWADIRDGYTPNYAVSGSTRSAIVADPLQYGPALLSASVHASAASIPDNDGDNSTNVSVTGTNFPLTGIMIGGQRVQFFNFTPKADTNDYTLYDARVRDASGSAVILTSSNSAAFRTLVFPTQENTRINVALEFRNDSGSAFYGAKVNPADARGQLIAPGTKFYLSSTLDIASIPEADRNGLTSVFTSDYVTSVSFLVESMASARNTIPDLRAPQLALGVRAEIQWQQVTPASQYVF